MKFFLLGIAMWLYLGAGILIAMIVAFIWVVSHSIKPHREEEAPNKALIVIKLLVVALIIALLYAVFILQPNAGKQNKGTTKVLNNEIGEN